MENILSTEDDIWLNKEDTYYSRMDQVKFVEESLSYILNYLVKC